MVQIHITSSAGERRSLDVAPGSSLMEVARDADVDEIIGECSGSLVCGTCHVYVAAAWEGCLPAASGDERDLLDCGVEIRPNSRLSCQIVVDPALDGLEISTPARQR
jgi:2Fe-2S ferredoxin